MKTMFRQLEKLAEAIKADFANDLAIGKNVTATNYRGNSRKYQTWKCKR